MVRLRLLSGEPVSESLSENQRPSGGDGPKGIDGWLILPPIHLVLDVIQVVRSTAVGMQKAPAPRAGLIHLRPPMESPLLMAYFLFCVLVCLYAVYCLVRFFQKKQDVPDLMIFFYLFIILKFGSNWILLWRFPDLQTASVGLSKATTGIFQSVIAGGIWISYFRMSVRVKNTFTQS